MKVHVRPFKSTFLEGGPVHSMLNDLDRRNIFCHAGKPPCSSHLLSAPPPLPQFAWMLNVGAATVMVPKQRRLVPLARTNFVGEHPENEAELAQLLLAQQAGRNSDGTVCAPKKLRGFNWAGHAVNNRSRDLF